MGFVGVELVRLDGPEAEEGELIRSVDSGVPLWFSRAMDGYYHAQLREAGLTRLLYTSPFEDTFFGRSEAEALISELQAFYWMIGNRDEAMAVSEVCMLAEELLGNEQATHIVVRSD